MNRSLGMRIGWTVLGLLIAALAVGGAKIVIDRRDHPVAGHAVGPMAAEPAPTGVAAPPSLTPPSPAPNEQISVAGTKNRKTFACNSNGVSVSGVDNTVVLTGRCDRVEVSGVRNEVTIDEAGAIVVSGVDNTVRFRNGTPYLEKSGIRNTLERG
ncbi:MAG: DUF3060 domain-containing protein [Mycobacterium sp.]